MSKPLTKIFLIVPALFGGVGCSFGTAERAEQGSATAQFNLGAMYHDGRGVPQDYQTAVKWYRLAAAQINASAQSNLGVIYHDGRGVPQDYQAAVKWFKLAAEQGDWASRFHLGRMYHKGQGVSQDYIYAHMWTNLAVTNGFNDAAETRDIIEKKMTSAQIAKAQRLAAECARKKYKGCETKY